MVFLTVLQRNILLPYIPPTWQRQYSRFFQYELTSVPNGGIIGSIVIFATFMIYGVVVGLEACYGLLYANMLTDTELTGADRGTLAWVGSIAIFLELALGIWIGRWIDRYGARKVCIIGGILMGGGLILSSLVTRVEELFITYSIIVGVGMAMAYGASSIAVGQYFTTKAPFANAAAGIGTGVGTIILAYVIQLLLVTNGWRSCMQLLSVISLCTICLCGLAYIPYGSALLTSIANGGTTGGTTPTLSLPPDTTTNETNRTITVIAPPDNASVTTGTVSSEPLTGLSVLQQSPSSKLQIRSPLLPSTQEETTTVNEEMIINDSVTQADEHDDDTSLPSTPLTSVSFTNNSYSRNNGPLPLPNPSTTAHLSHSQRIGSIPGNLPDSASSLSLANMVPPSPLLNSSSSVYPVRTIVGASPIHSSSAYPIMTHGTTVGGNNNSSSPIVSPSVISSLNGTIERNTSTSSSSSIGIPIHRMTSTRRYHYDQNISPYVTALPNSNSNHHSPLILSSNANPEELIKVINHSTRNTPLSPFLMPGAHSSAASIVPQVSLKAPALAALLRESNQRRPRSLTLNPSFSIGHSSLNPNSTGTTFVLSSSSSPNTMHGLGENSSSNNNVNAPVSSLYYLQNQVGRFHHQPLQSTTMNTSGSNSSSSSANNTNGSTVDRTSILSSSSSASSSSVPIPSSLLHRGTTGGTDNIERNLPDNDTSRNDKSGTLDRTVTPQLTTIATTTTKDNTVQGTLADIHLPSPHPSQPYEFQGYVNTQKKQGIIVSMNSIRSDVSNITTSSDTTTRTGNSTLGKKDDTPVNAPGNLSSGVPSLSSPNANPPPERTGDDPSSFSSSTTLSPTLDDEHFVQALEIALNDQTIVTTLPVTFFGKFLHWFKLLPSFRMQRTSALYVWNDFRFWAIAIAMALVISSITIPETHLGAYAEDMGMDAVFIGNLYSIMGFAGIIGRILFGLVTLRYDIDLLLLMQFCGITTGLSVFGLGIYGHLESYLVLNSVIIGGLGGSIFGFVSPILANLFGIPGLPYALGGTYTVRAPIVLIAAPIAGWVRERIGSYTHIWTVTGLCLILSALPIALMSTKCRRIR